MKHELHKVNTYVQKNIHEYGKNGLTYQCIFEENINNNLGISLFQDVRSYKIIYEKEYFSFFFFSMSFLSYLDCFQHQFSSSLYYIIYISQQDNIFPL
jgi:inner membrane protein involved in colicin E2 resistance